MAFNSSDSYVVASHNAGASFSARVKTNSDSLYWFAEGGAVAPNGTVYFSESAENQNATGLGSGTVFINGGELANPSKPAKLS